MQGQLCELVKVIIRVINKFEDMALTRSMAMASWNWPHRENIVTITHTGYPKLGDLLFGSGCNVMTTMLLI